MEYFEGIIGYKRQKEQLLYIIDMFKNRKIYEENNVYIPRGVLIYGDVGTGKTSLIEATIKQCNCPIFKIVSDKNENDTIKEISDVFKKALECENAIVFIDDLDKFGSSSKQSAFNAIQANIDKTKNKNIIVFATANDISVIPKSLLRKGRFDFTNSLENPLPNDAEEIIKYYLKNKTLDPNINLTDISKIISYESCAELECLINKAALYSVYNRKKYIDIIDVIKARLNDAYHNFDENYECPKEFFEECLKIAGHICIAELIKDSSIGFAYVVQLKTEDPFAYYRECIKFDQNIDNCLVSLGGKAACSLFLGTLQDTKRFEFDLGACVRAVQNEFTRQGKGGFSLSPCRKDNESKKSDSMCKLNETSISIEMERLFLIVKKMIINNKDFLFKIANELMKKKYLLFSDIKRIRESCNIVKVKY